LLRNTISCDRHDSTISNLHVNDNSQIPTDNTDKLYKVGPMVSALSVHFSKVYNGIRELSIDKSMILFKQHNPLKLIKWGYKMQCIADQKGCILNFDVRQPMNEDRKNKCEKCGFGEWDIKKATGGKYQTVYSNNFFNSLPLLKRLKVENTLACGTTRISRKGISENFL